MFCFERENQHEYLDSSPMLFHIWSHGSDIFLHVRKGSKRSLNLAPPMTGRRPPRTSYMYVRPPPSKHTAERAYMGGRPAFVSGPPLDCFSCERDRAYTHICYPIEPCTKTAWRHIIGRQSYIKRTRQKTSATFETIDWSVRMSEQVNKCIHHRFAPYLTFAAPPYKSPPYSISTPCV